MKLRKLPFDLSVCKFADLSGIFSVSTYNTDYILVKKENFERAQNVLKDEGYEI